MKYLLLITLIILESFSTGRAQFGINKANNKIQENEIQSDGSSSTPIETKQVSADIVNALLQANPSIEHQSAVDITAVIEAASNDPESTLMAKRMKEGNQLNTLMGEIDARQIVKGMETALDEMKMLDILFRDPDRAFVEMEKEGMIDEKYRLTYGENPKLLEEDTRKSLWFNFVSLAAAGGYL